MHMHVHDPTPRLDHGRWRAHVLLEKYDADEDLVRLGLVSPYEVIEREGNLLVNAGIALMLDKLIGAAGTVFDATNAYLGVGDSATAAGATQTDLQAATNKLRRGMEATFPSRSAQTMSWKASFATGDANWVWNEWGIFNASAGGTMLNRKVESLGTKASGTWVLTADVTIS